MKTFKKNRRYIFSEDKFRKSMHLAGKHNPWDWMEGLDGREVTIHSFKHVDLREIDGIIIAAEWCDKVKKIGFLKNYLKSFN